jgi:hypothetical protein
MSATNNPIELELRKSITTVRHYQKLYDATFSWKDLQIEAQPIRNQFVRELIEINHTAYNNLTQRVNGEFSERLQILNRDNPFVADELTVLLTELTTEPRRKEEYLPDLSGCYNLMGPIDSDLSLPKKTSPKVAGGNATKNIGDTNTIQEEEIDALLAEVNEGDSDNIEVLDPELDDVTEKIDPSTTLEMTLGGGNSFVSTEELRKSPTDKKKNKPTNPFSLYVVPKLKGSNLLPALCSPKSLDPDSSAFIGLARTYDTYGEISAALTIDLLTKSKYCSKKYHSPGELAKDMYLNRKGEIFWDDFERTITTYFSIEVGEEKSGKLTQLGLKSLYELCMTAHYFDSLGQIGGNNKFSWEEIGSFYNMVPRTTRRSEHSRFRFLRDKSDERGVNEKADDFPECPYNKPNELMDTFEILSHLEPGYVAGLYRLTINMKNLLVREVNHVLKKQKDKTEQLTET